MAQKFVIVAAVVCVLAVFVNSAPQFQNQNQFRGPQQFNQPKQALQAQPRSQDPERQSRFLVVSEKFNQDPATKEYNFE